MKIDFDRQEYLELEAIFEAGQLDDVTTELSEFSDDIVDLAYELAYTRYELTKLETRHNELREAVEWERECEDLENYLRAKDARIWKNSRFEWWHSHIAARAEVDKLLQEPI